MHANDLYPLVQNVLGSKASKVILALGEVTVECLPEHYLDIMTTLRDHADLHFESLVDLCGVDYSTYKNEPWEGKRFAVEKNQQIIPKSQLEQTIIAPNDHIEIIHAVGGG